MKIERKQIHFLCGIFVAVAGPNKRKLKQRRRRMQRERQKSIVHFIAVTARLWRETSYNNFKFYGGRQQKATIFFFFSWT